MTDLLSAAKAAAYLTDTATIMRGNLDDPIARAAAELLATVARTLTTAPPGTLFDYQPTTGAALHLARAYNRATA